MAIQFKKHISKMGPDRVIIIPRAMHEMLEGLEGKRILVSLSEVKEKKS